MLEYYEANDVVEVFKVPIETISKIYYWEGSRVQKTWNTRGTVSGRGVFSLPSCAFTFFEPGECITY